MEDTSRVYDERSSVYVAPLRIAKLRRTTGSVSKRSSWQQEANSGLHSRNHSHSTGGNSSTRSSTINFTLPPTPQTSLESLVSNELPAPPPFLRAFFPFQPTYTPGSATVTLPLDTNDLVLVYSVHNGWADGEILNTGMRGWLPTNYCEPYGPPQMLVLLRVTARLFELVREGSSVSTETSQTVGGIVAGVRALLVRLQGPAG